MMWSVYGLVPSDKLAGAKAVAEFPAFHGRPVGGAHPVDCTVALVKLQDQAIRDSAHWAWRPASAAYVFAVQDQPLVAIKTHLRNIRFMNDLSGQSRLWPWFDPRYLKKALMCLDGDELAQLFGPVQVFVFACESGLEQYSQNQGQLQVKAIPA